MPFDPLSYAMGAKSAGGGGGGSSTLAGLTDVDISNPTNGQTLVYNATSGKWENGAPGGGVMVITLDDTITLNRTWNEISNASFAVIKHVYGIWIDWYYVSRCVVHQEDGDIYDHTCYDVVGVFVTEDSTTMCMVFRADSPNGYPAVLP